MVGGGTSVEVAREMGIEAHGLDLHSGFNILKQRILEAVGKPSDLVLSHPPYHNIVVYSGKVWGRVGHPDDLSRCGLPPNVVVSRETVPSRPDATILIWCSDAVVASGRRHGGRYS